MKRFIITLLIGLSFAACSVVHADTKEESPRVLVHLLDYLAKDYGGAVASGKVINQSEYDEQVEFGNTVAEMGSRLELLKGEKNLQQDLTALKSLIDAKASPTEVARVARAAQAKVIAISGLERVPSAWPSLTRARQIYGQNCAACHGANGDGNGPAGKTLDPKPTSFTKDERVNELSPFGAFNTIRLGVSGTAMPSFSGLSDAEVWDLAFYVFALRHAESQGGELPPITFDSDLLQKTATLSDPQLAKNLGGSQAEQALKLAAVRLHSNDESQASPLALARANLKNADDAYSKGDRDKAKVLAIKAYLDGVEPVEGKIKANDPAMLIKIESVMGNVRSSIESSSSKTQVSSTIESALSTIAEVEELFQNTTSSPLVTLIMTSGILLREGFEAVLILVALLGVIRALKVRRAAAYVHAGWIAALCCGVIAWLFSGWVLRISGAQRELLEGVTSLIAVVMLFYMGFWLHSKTEIGRWKAFIDGKVRQAAEQKNLLGLTFIAFISVFREVFETVLFLRAVWLESGNQAKTAMLAGVTGSLVAVFIMAWLLVRFSAKLPIRKLFSVSSILLIGLALILTGKGFHSLQETGALSVTALPFSLRWDFVGVYGTVETLFSQLVVLAIAIGLWLYTRRPNIANSQRTS